jgi:hypothetical protein
MRSLRLLGLLALLGGCNTPSIPLPPPVLTALGFQQAPMAGLVVVQGQPEVSHADARFFVFNHSRGDGVITTARADGSFTTSPFAGSEGDTVELFYQRPDFTQSEAACITLRFSGTLLRGHCR